MKKIYHFFTLAILSVSLSSCLEDECDLTRTFHIWEAVYVQPADFRLDLVTSAGRVLNNPGKIYFYRDYILVNELREGIHVIDNQDPENPQNVAFIEIPGNVDMAVKENILYADSYVDLLSIDISNPADAQLLNRCEEVFPLEGFDPNLGYISHFVETQNTVELDCSDQNFDQPVWWFDGGFRAAVNVQTVDFAQESANTGRVDAASVGLGGSLARFTITENHLYAVSNFDLKVFGLGDLFKPELINEVSIGWGIETIFPYGENLFIGANDGMYIFDNSSPQNPQFLSKFQHARACDPVFVSGNLAYVTLRGGTICENFTNQLDVVDVSNLTRPELLATHPMHNPHGLSVADNHVFICENDQGLKVFDASNIEMIQENLTDHITGFRTFDVITLPNKVAIVVGADGLYQFDYSDPADLKQLSVISVQ